MSRRIDITIEFYSLEDLLKYYGGIPENLSFLRFFSLLFSALNIQIMIFFGQKFHCIEFPEIYFPAYHFLWILSAYANPKISQNSLNEFLNTHYRLHYLQEDISDIPF